MKTRVAVVGIAITYAALAAPLHVAAQGDMPAKRVEPFTHLTAPRVELGEPSPGEGDHRRLCPRRLDVCQKFWAYTAYFVDGYTIPLRDKEILILRTAWLSRGDYIWGRHYVRGQEAGLTKEEIGKITEGQKASGWSAFDATLLRTADELHTSRFLSDATWDALAERYTEDQQREVVMLVGDYTQLAMFQNSLGAQLPDGFEGLPN
jgi:alkylhydroperoxidase family enzyme